MDTTGIKGNVHHNLNPVLGWLALAIHDDKPLTMGQMRSAVEKLSAAKDAVADLPDA